MKLENKIKEQFKKQLCTNDRGDTWVGFRPSVFDDKKQTKKRDRREGKKQCKEGFDEL